jgi:hypothetical protein
MRYKRLKTENIWVQLISDKRVRFMREPTCHVNYTHVVSVMLENIVHRKKSMYVRDG